jgi:hypothetical protein
MHQAAIGIVIHLTSGQDVTISADAISGTLSEEARACAENVQRAFIAAPKDTEFDKFGIILSEPKPGFCFRLYRREFCFFHRDCRPVRAVPSYLYNQAVRDIQSLIKIIGPTNIAGVQAQELKPKEGHIKHEGSQTVEARIDLTNHIWRTIGSQEIHDSFEGQIANAAKASLESTKQTLIPMPNILATDPPDKSQRLPNPNYLELIVGIALAAIILYAATIEKTYSFPSSHSEL